MGAASLNEQFLSQGVGFLPAIAKEKSHVTVMEWISVEW